MAEWREPRVAKELPVRIRGTDHQGNPFVQDTNTLDVSRRGARVESAGPIQGPGEIVQLQRGWKKAHYQVVWLGEPGTLRQNQAGLLAMDSNPNIWGEPLPAPEKLPEPEPEVAPEPVAAPPPPKRTGQRSHSRYRCSGAVQIWQEGAQSPQGATVGEIGQGGCYLETEWPLPAGTRVELKLTLLQQDFHAKGRVCYVDGAGGMGIAFGKINDPDKERLEKVLAQLAARGEPF
jgi:hypothetical protein